MSPLQAPKLAFGSDGVRMVSKGSQEGGLPKAPQCRVWKGIWEGLHCVDPALSGGGCGGDADLHFESSSLRATTISVSRTPPPPL